MSEAFVGIGSNIQPQTNVSWGLAELADRFGELRVSQAYRCPAVGFDGADFINLVVGLQTSLTPAALQADLHAIETACGRDRSAPQGSRTLDLDLLLYGDVVLDAGSLHLPRADILKYAFVLRPLAELAPAGRHPVSGRSYADLWAAFDDREQPLTAVDITCY